MKLDDYKLKIDIADVPDEALELWFGQHNAKFIKLIKGYDIITDNSRRIYYVKDHDLVMFKSGVTKVFYVCTPFLNKFLFIDFETLTKFLTEILPYNVADIDVSDWSYRTFKRSNQFEGGYEKISTSN